MRSIGMKEEKKWWTEVTLQLCVATTADERVGQLVEMASTSCQPGVGGGSWCWGQTALETNEVFIWELGRLKCSGLCPWIPSVRIHETPEKRLTVLAWLLHGLLHTEDAISPSVSNLVSCLFLYCSIFFCLILLHLPISMLTSVHQWEFCVKGFFTIRGF